MVKFTVSVICEHGILALDDYEQHTDEVSYDYFINSMRVTPHDGWRAIRAVIVSSGVGCYQGQNTRTFSGNSWTGTTYSDKHMSWCNAEAESHANITITIEFERYAPPSLYLISTNSDPSGSGVTSGDGLYEMGASCTISVVPIQGYRFKRWTSDLGRTQTEKTATITVIGDVVWTAKLIATTGLILYLPSNNKVLYRSSNDKILRDE